MHGGKVPNPVTTVRRNRRRLPSRLPSRVRVRVWACAFRLKGGASTVSSSARDESTGANRLGIWQGRPQRQAPARRLVLVTDATRNVGEPAPQKKSRSPVTAAGASCVSDVRTKARQSGLADLV